ncbi:hypothetical protein POSPLADRAFT_1056801 [Postia placenta MAD-698-R-SB12]|uniref:Uncharacterized protein n=1 Tax=Postia placenta MAD-698-R-SB12 TaxID=670580 RepID=A0A1X6N0R4_9APHY|nr:hypothetical protein POSPLADRAFT_1056801 [Postia placenta MAD-698-R-SB12]OSX62215.1 hypothetical protein POSPLADRAFT_1056801 [Postia placenta MAD-698-R-SB12]
MSHHRPAHFHGTPRRAAADMHSAPSTRAPKHGGTASSCVSHLHAPAFPRTPSVLPFWTHARNRETETRPRARYRSVTRAESWPETRGAALPPARPPHPRPPALGMPPAGWRRPCCGTVPWRSNVAITYSPNPSIQTRSIPHPNAVVRPPTTTRPARIRAPASIARVPHRAISKGVQY